MRKRNGIGRKSGCCQLHCWTRGRRTHMFAFQFLICHIEWYENVWNQSVFCSKTTKTILTDERKTSDWTMYINTVKLSCAITWFTCVFFSLTQISIHNCHHVIRSFIWRCPLSVVICFVSGYRTLFSRLVYIVWCTRCRTLWHSPRQLNCQIHSVKWKLPLFGIPFGMQNSEKAFEANFTSYWILQADFPHIDRNNCHTTTKNAMWYYYLWSEKMLMVDERMENVLIFIRCRAQIVYMIFRVFSRCCCRCSIKVSFIFSNTSSSCQIECISTERASHTGYFSDEIDRQPDTETTWCGHFVWIFLQTRLDIQKRTSITKPFDGFCTKSPTKKSCNSRSRIDRRNGRISLIVCVPSAFGQCHPSAFAGHQRFRKCVIKNSCFDGTLLDVCIWWREC